MTIELNLSKGEAYQLRIFNNKGKIVFEKYVKAKRYRVNKIDLLLPNLATSTYILEIKTKTDLYTTRVTKQNR